MAKYIEETLKKLQEGAAEHNGTVMLEGERFRVRSEDGYSCLYEFDQEGKAFRLVERVSPKGVVEPIKDGGESSSVNAAIKELEEGPKKRKVEQAKEDEKAEAQAEKEREAAKSAAAKTSHPPADPTKHAHK